MSILNLIFVIIAGYVLGSIPSAVWASKISRGIDIRKYGSGNAGATNVIRVLGWKTGIPVLIIDIAKGWLAASLPVFFQFAANGSNALITMQILGGIAAIAGHLFPVFAGFKGGKGVGTTIGILLALNPLLTLSCLVIFMAVLLITGYVSLSSISFGIVFPILLFTVFKIPSIVFKIFSIFIAVMIIFTHRKNIQRLLKGEESRFIKKKTANK